MISLNKNQNINYSIIMFCITILLVFFARDQFFNLGNYFLLPIITIICSAFYLATMQINIILRIEHICVLSILGYAFFIVYVLGKGSEFDIVAATLLFYLFFLLMVSIDLNERSLKWVVNAYVISALILAIILLIQMKPPYPGQIRYGIYYSSTDFYDVNFTATFMLIPALITFNQTLVAKVQKKRIRNGIFTLIIFLAIALTGSRGSIVPLIAVFCYRMVTLRKLKISYLFTLLLLLIVVYIALPDELFNRFFVDSYESNNVRRLHAWEYGIQSFLISPWFGNGLYSTKSIIESTIGIVYNAHNTFIVILTQYGIIGAIPNVFLLIYPILKFLTKKTRNNLLLYYLSFIFSLIMIEANLSLVILIPLTIMYMALNYVKKNPSYDISNIM
ncbi:putative inorganic carbon (HCO3(-)) transporter [Bacillus sp. SLBN-46]|uniref:O-antigen ligase family protein n=1 Tax=Bacillus sp. SLBN-46 TaxID=3042283 RepID=UPI0028652B44|nr:O-antigen ligase family protein [Bacillus sp. SLBN-46]MDR6121163.1 putative inorganic carbon (HCO3(-)) transporter [Bacillus sp. SLBN-46]